jgi:predicted nucleic acid-binding Zn ribbon protein
VPKYIYLCKACENHFEVKHSLQKKWTICEECGVTDCLERKPSGFFLSKKQDKLSGKSKPGTIVKESIEDFQQDLKTEQERLEKREYNNVK